MKDETFTELLGSAHEALEHAQGKRNLRTTTLPLPPKPLNGRAVKRVRASLHASQAVFARYLNVSTKLVQAWEANRRTPDGPALVLLHIAARQPHADRERAAGRGIRSPTATSPASRARSHAVVGETTRGVVLRRSEFPLGSRNPACLCKGTAGAHGPERRRSRKIRTHLIE